MKKPIACLILLTLISVAASAGAVLPKDQQATEQAAQKQRNVVIFIADGLRHDSVTQEVAPTMFALRRAGVDFVNSHSLYPTFTTPNASAFATGHLLGDTGDFGNALYVGHPIGREATGGTLVPFIENDLFIAKLNQLYRDNYLGEATLASLARENGYTVAVIGKLGPVAIQDAGEVALLDNSLQPTSTLIVDDSTGPQGIPLPRSTAADMTTAGLSTSAPDRSNGQDANSKGNNSRSAGTLAANFLQQQYFANVATQVFLPAAVKETKPFLLIYWSRDPDGSQHGQADSLDQLVPGINGPTSRAGVHNADNNLWQIVDYLKNNGLLDNTDIIVVADHGFSTISKKEVSRTATPTHSYAATLNYADVKPGYLPPGFLAIDLAHALKLPLYDPDAPAFSTDDGTFYQPIEICDCAQPKFMRHTTSGNGVLGGSGRVPIGNQTTDAEVLVAANGGSDLIYLPQDAPQKHSTNAQLAQRIAEFLLQQDYVDGVFVNDDLGDIPGTLPLSAIGLKGSTSVPRPALLVNFKSFSLDSRSLLSRVEIADSTLQEGQGMHGSFSRADTFNAMLAFGPDFKASFIDSAPTSNADIAMTIASLLNLKFPESKGKLRGRVIREALKGSSDPSLAPPPALKTSHPGKNGMKTILQYQTFDGSTYLDRACVVKDSPGSKQTCN